MEGLKTVQFDDRLAEQKQMNALFELSERTHELANYLPFTAATMQYVLNPIYSLTTQTAVRIFACRIDIPHVC